MPISPVRTEYDREKKSFPEQQTDTYLMEPTQIGSEAQDEPCGEGGGEVPQGGVSTGAGGLNVARGPELDETNGSADKLGGGVSAIEREES